MSDNFSNILMVNFNIPSVISITISTAILKHLICEFTECSLCINHWFTYTIFLVMAMAAFFIVTTFSQTSNWLNVPSTLYNSTFIRFLLLATFFHTFSLASSSFVEEEHQTWYFIAHTFLFIICIMSLKKRQNDQWLLNAEPLLKTESRRKRTSVRSLCEQFYFEFSWLVLLVLLLVGRRMNQTGDKWINESDIGDFLTMEQNRFWNSCFVVMCKYATAVSIRNNQSHSVLHFLALCAMIYKVTEFNGTLTNILTFTAAVLIYYYRTLSGYVYFAGIKPSE